MVICLEQGADLHMAQLMPLPLTVSCSSKIQIGFTFLVPAHLGSPGRRAVKRVCVCVLAFRGSPRQRAVKRVCVCVPVAYKDYAIRTSDSSLALDDCAHYQVFVCMFVLSS